MSFTPCPEPEELTPFKPCANLDVDRVEVKAPVKVRTRCTVDRKPPNYRASGRTLLAVSYEIALAGPLTARERGCVSRHEVLAPVQLEARCVAAKGQDRVPVVDGFYAKPRNVVKGSTTNLHVLTRRARVERISHGVGEVTGAKVVQVRPAASTVYSLKASNAYGAASMQADVQIFDPVAPPEASEFLLEPLVTRREAAPPGTTRRIGYEFGGGTGTTAVVTDSDGTVVHTPTDDVGHFDVAPTDSETYTLTVSNPHGADATRSITVGVLPAITSFTVTPTRVERGSTVRLEFAWTGAGATGSVDQGVGAVQSGGHHEVQNLRETTQYTLTVSNAHGSVSRTVNAEAYVPYVAPQPWTPPVQPSPASYPAPAVIVGSRILAADESVIDRFSGYTAYYVGYNVPLVDTVDTYIEVRSPRPGSSGQLGDAEWLLYGTTTFSGARDPSDDANEETRRVIARQQLVSGVALGDWTYVDLLAVDRNWRGSQIEAIRIIGRTAGVQQYAGTYRP